LAFLTLLTAALGLQFPLPSALAQQSVATASAKAIGIVKSISGRTAELTSDAGAEIQVMIPESGRIVLAVPGQKDLQGATPIPLQDVHVGDRMLVRGAFDADGKTVIASSAVVMKSADVAQKQQRDRDDWQKRGDSGLVKSVDPVGGTITLSSGGRANRQVIVRLSSTTIVRRYAPDSVKFDDARPGSINQIKPGDQLRARGTRNPDGDTLVAEEIISGSFRNVAGTVLSVDTGAGTMSVMDLATRKPLTLRVTTDSQLRVLPPALAQRIAARLKSPSSSTARAATPASENQPSAGTQPNRPPDFQQILSRMPQAQVSDLHKGDAVMIVATEGSASTPPTTITLLGGVEPILSAAPATDGAAILLSPWSLGGGDSGATQ
jgi:hypothetical protein